MRKTSRTYELSLVNSAFGASRSFLAGFACIDGVFHNGRPGASNIKGLSNFQEFLIGRLIVFCFGRLVPENSAWLRYQPVFVK
jgi:hypothetical protein